MLIINHLRKGENNGYRSSNQRQSKERKEINRAAVAAEQHPDKESPPAQRHRGDLKKRTQFIAEPMGTMPCVRKDYDSEPPAGVAANKAKQTQFQAPAASDRKGAMSETCRVE